MGLASPPSAGPARPSPGIGFQAARQVGMEDETTSGFVDAMPKAMVATMTMAARS